MGRCRRRVLACLAFLSTVLRWLLGLLGVRAVRSSDGVIFQFFRGGDCVVVLFACPPTQGVTWGASAATRFLHLQRQMPPYPGVNGEWPRATRLPNPLTRISVEALLADDAQNRGGQGIRPAYSLTKLTTLTD
jgi:hypothetical protein